MKKLTFILAFVALTSNAFSQNMPQEGNSGLGFNVTGLANVAFGNFGQTALSGATVNDPLNIINDGYSFTLDALIPQNMIMYKRYYGDGLASRFGLGINGISMKSTTGDSTGTNEYTTTEMKTSGHSFGLTVGLEKHCGDGTSKVDPYMGVDVMFAMFTGLKYSSITDVTGETTSSSATADAQYPGGLGFGLNLLGGFNYFFSDNISIGGEVGLGFHMMSMGGEWTLDTVNTDVNGNNTTTTETHSVGEYKNTVSGLNVNSYGGVNLIVYW